MGTVRDLGYCDASPGPLQDATVFIQGTGGFTATVTTAADGTYQFWMPTTKAPLAVTASKVTDFVVETVTDILLGASPTTQNFDLRRNQPCVSTDPQSYEVTIVRGGTLTTPLILSNDGALGTDFEIAEVAGGFVLGMPMPETRTIQTSTSGKSPASQPAKIKVYPTALRPATSSPVLINDGSFEGTAWTEVDDTGCTPWIGDWSSILGITAYDGLRYFWAGGYCGAPNSNSAAQNITLPADAGTLTFWYQALRSDPDDVTNGSAYVKINGATLWSLPMVQANNTAAWVQVTVDVSAYAGQSVELMFGADQAGTGVGKVTFDYVEVSSGGGAGSAIVWLSESPITGTLASDSSQNANIIFDTTMLTQTGSYSATLNLDSDDLVHPELPIPVTMHVILPTYAVSLSSDPLILVGDRGTWVTHVVTVTNDGNDPYGDTFSLSTSGNGWITMVQPTSVFLLPDQSTTVNVAVFIPASILPGSLDNVVVNATSISTVFAEISLTTVARSTAPVLTPETDALTGYVDSSVVYTLHLVNTNTYTDTFILSASGNSWTTNLDQVVVVLGGGQSIDILVTVTIPSGGPSGVSDVVAIEAKSLLDPTKTDQSVLTTTSMLHQWFLPIIAK